MPRLLFCLVLVAVQALIACGGGGVAGPMTPLPPTVDGGTNGGGTNGGGTDGGGTDGGGTTGQPAFVIQRDSVSSGGAQSNASSSIPSLSSDGRFVAFQSEASNLVPDDTNGLVDVFVRDRQAGATSRVSVATGNIQSVGGGSAVATISGDGGIVVFLSFATNLVPTDTNASPDVFVHDRGTGVTTRVSVDSAGAQANGGSDTPGMSADGRLVVFSSDATNLVPNDTNGVADIFLHDRQTGQTSRISVDSSGAQADDGSFAPFISADGGIVVFSSFATNLVPGDTNGVIDVFVRNLVAGTTTRVSVSSTGVQSNGDSGFDFRAQVTSADGRFVIFDSDATNLVDPPTNGFSQVYLHDRLTGTTRLLSTDAAGNQGNAASFGGFLSGDGRFATFQSEATNLVPNAPTRQLYLRDLQAGTIQIISVNAAGEVGNDRSDRGVFSLDGRFIGFQSSATNLVPDDTNGVIDIFTIQNPLVP
ncbi:hypothetical protein DYH09_22765 [bacterium CPR1]|nr:hypothetical protein [bacterium CPR1]